MKTTVNFYTFREAFRAIRPTNFSSEGLACLFEYLEALEEDMGQEIELDVIAFCCDYAEDTWQDIAENYRIDLSECETDDDKRQAVDDYLSDEGCYIGEVGSDRFVYRTI